jgi:hypothetical protein
VASSASASASRAGAGGLQRVGAGLAAVARLLRLHRCPLGAVAHQPVAQFAHRLLQAGPAGAEVREQGGLLLQRLLRLGQGGGDLGHAVAGNHLRLGARLLLGAQHLALVGEALQHAGGVGGKRLLALQVLRQLHDAPLQVLPAGGDARLLLVELAAGEGEALERGGGLRLGLAQRRQFMGGDGLEPRRLGLDAGGLGAVAHARLDRALGLGQRRRHLAPAQPQKRRLALADLGGEALVAHGLARLALEALHLGAELDDHVLDPGEVLLGRLEAHLRLVAAGMQARDAGRLLQDAAARIGLGADDLADLPLAHQGRGAGAGGGVGEQQVHVARPHVAPVDPVGRSRAALDAAHHLQLVPFVEAGRGGAVGIVELQRHLGGVARRAPRGTGEDHVVHVLGAHGLVRAFAHDPAQRLDEVGLAAPVRAHHTGEAGLDDEVGGLDEGLEAHEPQAVELHFVGRGRLDVIRSMHFEAWHEVCQPLAVVVKPSLHARRGAGKGQAGRGPCASTGRGPPSPAFRPRRRPGRAFCGFHPMPEGGRSGRPDCAGAPHAHLRDGCEPRGPALKG